MATLVIYMVLVIGIVLFASQNLDMVSVHLIAGNPVEVPLIVVVGLSFFVGFVTAIFSVIIKTLRDRGKQNRYARPPGNQIRRM
ncbi:lipopolysaccharide assembly protein LapA domain-containing protein [Magnetospira sp. QH-2]|uniref:lipopolysaccharide assembly protein LapA domain-containing protein n=1 Tax=Magnetospira sp. (strain QH-2) TaxID=1288970 RepID=UPI0003E81BA2|nr:LapA family protein [Magnetospira sp. QH-2]CCQ72993.1 magnetosome protein MamL [Magnetospira sp. QH-2]